MQKLPKKFANKRLGGRSVNIGMDAALTVGHSTVNEYKLINGTNFFSISDQSYQETRPYHSEILHSMHLESV